MKNRLVTQVMYRRMFLLVMTALLVLASFGAVAASGEKFIQEPDKPSRVESLKVKESKIEIGSLKAGASELSFYEVRLRDGSVAGVGIAETTRAGQSGIAAVPRLKDANALEVFNAVSEPGTRIPRELMMLYGQPELGQQGWALPLPLTDGGNPQEISCMVGAEPWNAFKSDIESKGYTAKFLSEKDGPGTQPGHWFDDNGQADGTIRRQLQGGVDNKTHFYGKVSYCYEDLYEPTGFHGRYVYFSYRISDFLPAWTQLTSVQLMDPGDSASYHFTPVPGFDAEFDFRMNITAAKTSDMFHIGATWANPGGTITLGK